MTDVQTADVASAGNDGGAQQSGGGSSTCTPAVCAGCCDGKGVCQPGTINSACGSAGAACVACLTSSECTGGQCTSICTPNCAGKCGGADDGCGGHCSTTCDAGCCGPDGTCQSSATSGQCAGDDGGACSPACSANQVCCPSGCADTTTDLSNCGACGTTCTTTFKNVAAACVGGTCSYPCAAGFARCTLPTGDCETNVASDNNNCGGCGHVCPAQSTNATTSCEQGQCVLHCQAGWADCDGVFDNGCETNLDTGANCGACAAACPTCVAQTCCTPTSFAACASPVQIGALAVGQTVTYTGNLPASVSAAGDSTPNANWLVVTFAGSNADPNYHPHITLTSTGGAFSFSVFTDCTGAAAPVACGDGTPTTGLTQWEVFNSGGFIPTNPGAVPPPAAGTVYIQVLNGATADCSSYSLTISD